MNEALKIAYPEWTEYQEKNGRDPLGMQNTSVALYQSLLPGISNVTLRVRYYGLYAWLSWIYANRIRDTNPKSWQYIIRQAEALYALVAQFHGSETGVAGVTWAGKKLNNNNAGDLLFAEDAEPDSPTHYLKQAWGAYGAAYGSPLFEIGILANAEGHKIPVPSPGIGEPLAKAFANEIGTLAEKFFETIQRGRTTLEELDAFSALTPSAIRVDGDERKQYQDILFGGSGLHRAQDEARRKSLLLVLKLADQMGRTPNIEDVRWALYAGRLNNGTPLLLNENLDTHRNRWLHYQANDLSHICFECLLKFILDTLEGHPTGVPLVRLISEAVDKLLLVAVPVPETWQNLLAQIVPAENAWAEDDANAEYHLSNAVMRAARQEGLCKSEEAWAAIKLLAVLHSRHKQSFDTIQKEFGAFDPGAFRSVLTEMLYLEEHLEDPFREMLANLFQERVIRRHLHVALRKLRFQRDYTYLLEPDDGKIRLRAKDGPVFTNPRLGPALTFLKDIHLLGNDGLTKLGRQMLEGAA
ncbi:MAG: hypothetical protein OXI37_05760 [Gammaproteobacteria bacterium]|nr:hypothetical protein [Gammaproteobacteria bacterium]